MAGSEGPSKGHRPRRALPLPFTMDQRRRTLPVVQTASGMSVMYSDRQTDMLTGGHWTGSPTNWITLAMVGRSATYSAPINSSASPHCVSSAIMLTDEKQRRLMEAATTPHCDIRTALWKSLFTRQWQKLYTLHLNYRCIGLRAGTKPWRSERAATSLHPQKIVYICWIFS